LIAPYNQRNLVLHLFDISSRKQGVPAQSFTGSQLKILTDGNFSNGKIEMIGDPQKVGSKYIYQNMSDEEKRIFDEEKRNREKAEKGLENMKGTQLAEEKKRIEEEKKKQEEEAKILSDNSDNRALIWILGLLGISGSMFWRLHSERGQIYILYIFLFSFSFYLYDKYQKKNNNRRFNSLFVASALIFGYLISLRPTFIFAIIPFLIYKKFKFASIIIAGMAASVLISSLLSPAPLWKSYSRSIQLQTLLFSDETINYQPYDQNIADGLNLKNSLSVPGEDSSLFRIFRAVFNQWFSSQTLFILLLGFLIIISLIIYKYKIPEISSRQLFFLAIALSFFSEFFIAAPRWPYANVIWLIPLSIMIAEAKKIAVSRLVILADVIVFLGLIANLGFHLIPRFTFIGDVGIPTATLLFLIAMLRRVSTKKDVFAVQ